MFSVLFVGFIQSFSFPACLLRKLQESFNFISEREIEKGMRGLRLMALESVCT